MQNLHVQYANRNFLYVVITLITLTGFSFPAFSQNTVFYKFSTDTTASLLLDRNANNTNLSKEPYLIAPNLQNVNSAVLELPFPVSFMGVKRTHFLVNSNGCVVLAPSASIAFTAGMANNFQSVNSNYAVLAPFWSSLKTAHSGVKYKVLGTAPYRTLVVEWYATAPASSVTTDYDMQFQARFYETNNIIEFVYGKMKCGVSNPVVPVKATIGFSTTSANRDSSFIALLNADTLSITRKRTELATAQNLINQADTGIIQNLHSTDEGQRRRFVFIPDAVAAPTTLDAFNITYNEALLYWNDNSQDELGFNVYRIENSEYILDTAVAPNISFRSLFNLLAGTTYQYRVQVYNQYTSAYSNILTFRTREAETVVAQTSGLWNDTATWGGVIPTINDSIIIPSGIKVVMNSADARGHSLLLNGELEYEDNAVARKLSLTYDLVNNGKLTANNLPSYNALLHELNIGRSLVNNGHLDFYRVVAPYTGQGNNGTYTTAVHIKFFGKENSLFACNGDTTNVYLITLTKDDIKDSLTISGVNLSVRNATTDVLSGTAVLSSATQTGTLHIGGTFTLENRLFPTVTIGTANKLNIHINNPNFTLKAINGDVTLNNDCGFGISKGTVNINGSLLLNNTARLIVNGGVLNVNGLLRNTNASQPVTVMQTGGKIYTKGITLNAASNIIQLNGGDFLIGGNAVLLGDINKSSFGTTRVYLGTADSLLEKTYTVNGYFPSVVFGIGVSNRTFTLNGQTTVYGDVWVNQLTQVNIAGNTFNLYGDSLFVAGNINGTTGGKLYFTSSASQQISGTGSIAVDIFETDRQDTTYHLDLDISGKLKANSVLLSGGKITHARNLVVGNGNAVVKLQYGKSDGQQQGGYLDTLPEFNLTASKYYITYLQEPVVRVTGYEIPVERKVAGLFFNNTAGIKVNGGSIEVYDTLRLDNGIITTSYNNEIILTDTLNAAALVGGGSHSFFKGSFSRRIPANAQADVQYIFPVGDSVYKSFVIENPVVTNTSTDIRVRVSETKPEGIPANSLRTIDSTVYWYVSATRAAENLVSYKAKIHNTRLTSYSRVAVAATVDTLLTSSTVFQSAGKRIAYYIDTLETTVLTSLNQLTPINFFVQAEATQDTLFEGTYRVGEGEHYRNLSDIAEALNNSYIDGALVFELTQNYNAQDERFPVSFEQSLHTASANSKNVRIKLANNVTGIITTNGNKTLIADNALININGADSLFFDGQGYDINGNPTGNIEWTFRTENNTTQAPVFRFVNDAQYNTLEFLEIIGNSNLATILISNSNNVSGNDYNTIAACHITSQSSANISARHIYALGSSTALNDNNRIINNYIYDFGTAGVAIDTGNGSGWHISGNHFYKTFAANTFAFAINFIPADSSSDNIISGNHIGGAAPFASSSAWAHTSTALGTLIAIQVNAGTALPTIVSDNRIKNITVNTADYKAISITGGHVIVLNNNIGGTDLTDKIQLGGRNISSLIHCVSSSAATVVEISDNIIENIVHQATVATAICRAIAVEGTLNNAKVYNNTIRNLRVSFGTLASSNYSLTGLYVQSSADNILIENNVLSAFRVESTTNIAAMILNDATANGRVFGNEIFNINSAPASAASCEMVGISASGRWQLANNKIALFNAEGNQTRSINVTGLLLQGNSNIDVVHNTVLVGGQVPSFTNYSSAYTQSESVNATLKNNILINTRRATSGINLRHQAFRINDGLGLNTQSDNNLYYATDSVIVLNASGSAQYLSLTGYNTLREQDYASVEKIFPAFVDTAYNNPDLNLKDTTANCLLKGSGTKIDFVDTDHKGKLRHATQPDIGADEFTYSYEMPAQPVLLSGNETLCGGETRTLIVNNPPVGGDMEWFAQAGGGAVIYTGYDFTTGAIPSDTTFYVQLRSGNCKSYRTKVDVKVKWLQAPVTDTLVEICRNETITLKAASSDSVVWYTALSDTAISNDTVLVLNNVNADTVLYVAAKRNNCESQKVRVNVKVFTQPVLPFVDSILYACYQQPFSITANPKTGTLLWYADSTTTTPFYSGNLLQLSSLEQDTTLYYGIASGTCVHAERKQVTVKVNHSAIPQTNFAGVICAGQPATLQIVNAGNATVKWYNSDTASTVLFTGNTFNSGILTKDTSFYTTITNGTCSSSRVEIPVHVVAAAEPPVIVSTNEICRGTTTQLQVSSEGSVKWFTSLHAITPISTDTFLTTTLLYNDTTFYAEATYGNCVSERIPVKVKLNNIPEPPLVTPVGEICSGQRVVLNATAADSVKWYVNSSASNPVSRVNTYTTNNLTATTTIYVETDNGICKSNRIPVVINVVALPNTPVVAQTNYGTCFNELVTLRATSLGNIINWYASAESNIILKKDTLYTTGRLTNDTTFFVETDNGTCRSERVAVPVSVLNYLSGVKLLLPDSAAVGEDISIQTEGLLSSIYSWNFGQGASLSSASGQGPFTLHYKTSGNKTITLAISRRSGALSCDTVITKILRVADTTRVGIRDLANPFLSFNVYPNPAKEQVNIEFDLEKSTAITLNLFDAVGKLVWQEQSGNVHQYKKSVDVSALGKGLYILKIISENGYVQNKKIIVE